MDGQNAFEAIPKLPPPPIFTQKEPILSQRTAERLRRAYRLWCSLTISTALLTLGLLSVQWIGRLQHGGEGYLRELIFSRLLGVSEPGEEQSLIELMLEQVLFPRGTTVDSIPVQATQTEPPATESTPLPKAETTLPEVVIPEPPDIYAYDPAIVPEGEMPILPLDLSLSAYGSAYISNETAYTPDLHALLEKTNILPPYSYTSAAIYPQGEPLVLILHTHGTEAYSPEGATSYPDSPDYARSSDPTENVIAVGARMAEVLRKKGIPTLHCVVLHDKTAYRDAYVRAAETIAAYLAEYPSIQYVFDVHRDALIRGENELVRPVVALDNEAVAQVMILAGSDYKGAYFPDWEDNLAFALQLRERLNLEHPGIARPVYLRGAAFNEHFGPRSLLLEIGASGNSLTEALRAGERVATVLADMIRGQ